MLLADVIRVDRSSGAALVGPNADFRTEVMHRGRRSVAVDLKRARGREVVLGLVERADVLMEGFRPGVAERLGIGPEDCFAVNPRLVYGRMTDYGQDGPMAQAVGHDLNYVAQSGVLALIGRHGQPPTPPLSLVGDFGGGGMVLALGILAALWETARSGRGQVVDAAMVDGAALLGAAFHGFVSNGTWHTERGTNVIDSGAPFYDAYETADGGWLAVAAMERHFYAELLEILDLNPSDLPDQYDEQQWPQLKKVIADAVRSRPRDEWVARAAGRGCVSAVLGRPFTITAPGGTAVCSLWHCPAGCPGWALPTTLPCGAGTFLDASLSCGRRRGRPASPSRGSEPSAPGAARGYPQARSPRWRAVRRAPTVAPCALSGRPWPQQHSSSPSPVAVTRSPRTRARRRPPPPRRRRP